MLKLSQHWWRRLRFLALLTMIAGIIFSAIKLPMEAFGAETEIFDRQVGWANILAFSLAAVGFLVLWAEKGGNLISVDHDLDAIVGKLSIKARRRGARTLAQLLRTDGLDSRSAPFRLDLTEAKNSSSKSENIERGELGNYFSKKAKGRMVILGAPGSGKSVLLLQLADQLFADAQQSGRIPLILSLATWDSSKIDLEDWLIAGTVAELAVKEGLAKRLVREQRIIPLLDGLDEMGTSGETSRSMRAVERLNDYIATTPDCRLVITSRDARLYGRLARRLRDIKIVVISPLTGRQIERHIRTHCEHSERFDEWHNVFNWINSQSNHEVCDLLGTPWRLTAAIIYFLDGGDPAALIPKKSENVSSGGEYQRRVSAVLMDGFVCARVTASVPTRYVAQNMAQLLILARRLTCQKTSEWQNPEIVLHHWWRNVGEEPSRLVHLAIAFLLLHFPSYTLGMFDDKIAEGGLEGIWLLVALGANCVTIGLIALNRSARDREPSRLSLENLRHPLAVVVSVLLIMLLSGFAVLMAYVYDSVHGALFGVIAILMLILATGTSTSYADDVLSPLQVIRNDRNVAALSGILFGAYGVLYYFPIYGISVAIWFGGMCAIGRFCCSAYMRYVSAATYGYFKYRLPWGFARFLSRGRSAGILRVSGAGYQFRHREIWEYLDSVNGRIVQLPRVLQ
ncbi:NACHT domain-containing protein [Allokutzneria multivorans]|uniref:NACHT domain-containing protein n=1 Tax=Allokutzneria multivorans TaxID=1142134 RepID=UPI0031EBC261